MKPYFFVLAGLVAAGLVCAAALTEGRPAGANGGADSGCVQCHTDVKKLIRLSWAVERIRGRPAISAQTEGEG